ncbi:MAG: adenosylcobinamide-GDP ribazoletransferase [Clostridia bacterium]
MRFLKSLVVAFSMYSALPMPQFAWDEENMQYAMAFFPVVGIAIAGSMWGYFQLAHFLQLTPPLFAALALVLMVVLSGGLHLDGFCDTADALYSRREQAEKLRILKDPHAGPFAIFSCVLLLLLQFAAFQQMVLNNSSQLVIILIFPLVRSLSGLSVLIFPKARKDGLVHTFATGANKWVVVWLGIQYGLCLFVLLQISLVICLLFAISSLLCFGGYYLLAKGAFGGTTGDVAGFFLEITQTVLLLIAVIV